MLSRDTGIEYLCYLFHIYDLGRENKIDNILFFFPLNHVQCFSACRLLLQNVRLGVLLIMVFIAVLEARSPRSGCQHG